MRRASSRTQTSRAAPSASEISIALIPRRYNWHVVRLNAAETLGDRILKVDHGGEQTPLRTNRCHGDVSEKN